jgi:hypothetical protein
VSRIISVGIATGYRLDCRGSIPGRGKRFFHTPQQPDRLRSPSRSSVKWVLGTFSLGVKRQGG